MKAVGLQEPIEFRFDEELHLTTPGRVLINSAVYRALDELLPPDEELEFDFMNQTLAKADTDRYVLSPVGPLRRAHAGAGARHDQDARLQVRHEGRRHDLEERHRHPAGQGEDPGRLREARRRGARPVRHGPDHRRRAPRDDRQHLDRGDRRGRHRDGGPLRRAEPGVHDGQLRRPRIDEADPPARRYARPDGESEGRDHRAPDQGQLHGRPVGARVLHLDPRRPQGPRRHRPPHRGLGLPDAASRRRLAGRDRPRGRLRHRRPHRRSRFARATVSNKSLLGRVDLGRHLQAARVGQARQAAARSRTWRHGDARAARGARDRARAGLPDPRSLGAQVPRRDRVSARPATASSRRRARCARSATRSASSPRSRSASRARS